MSNIFRIQGLGERIRKRREALNMSQRSLANLTGLSVRSISALEAETPNPTIETLLRICQELNCDISYLLGYSEYLTKEHEMVSTRFGLSPSAADKLVMLNLYSLSRIPAYERYGKQYLDLISDALSSNRIATIVNYYGEKMEDLSKYEMTDEEARIFTSKELEYEYYCHAMAKELQAFLMEHFLPNGFLDEEEEE